ncbi:Protein of unknown function [Magnetospira sp. QH-2]|nr:Protein of unknown function [Magnetospira sp. QH-2]
MNGAEGGTGAMGVFKPRSHKDILKSRLQELDVDPKRLPKGFIADLVPHLYRHFIADRKAQTRAEKRKATAYRLPVPFSFHITQAALVIAWLLAPRKRMEEWGKGRWIQKLTYADRMAPVLKKYGLETSQPDA